MTLPDAARCGEENSTAFGSVVGRASPPVTTGRSSRRPTSTDACMQPGRSAAQRHALGAVGVYQREPRADRAAPSGAMIHRSNNADAVPDATTPARHDKRTEHDQNQRRNNIYAPTCPTTRATSEVDKRAACRRPRPTRGHEDQRPGRLHVRDTRHRTWSASRSRTWPANAATISRSVTVKANGSADDAPRHSSTRITDQAVPEASIFDARGCLPVTGSTFEARSGSKRSEEGREAFVRRSSRSTSTSGRRSSSTTRRRHSPSA